MKKSLLLLSTVLSTCAFSQVTLFQDNFESGSGNWTMNSGGTGLNQWVVNSEYVDGSGWGLVPDTPDQPMGTFNGPQSSYMHIYNTQACNSLSICNASFDTGSSSNRNSMMASPLSTTGFTNVTLSFIYLCEGLSGGAYGVVEYSTDGGTSWNAASGQYSGVSSWTTESLSLAAFNNVASLKFRFRWQNGGAGNDPAFAVDEVVITGVQGNFATVSTGAIANTSYCTNASANISVPFTVTGTVNAGNQYIAQLSDNTGSFASPTTIGTLTSSANGSLSINATLPSGLSAGNNYLIRVVATDPATTGTNSSTTISVVSAPTASILALPANGNICPGESATLQGSGGVAYSWSPSASLDNSNTQTVSATPAVTTVYTLTVAGQTGCVSTATFTVSVVDCASIEENNEDIISIYPNPASNIIQIAIENEAKPIAYKILDVNGRVVIAAKFQESIDVSLLSVGTYTIQIETDTKTIRKQLVKK